MLGGMLDRLAGRLRACRCGWPSPWRRSSCAAIGAAQERFTLAPVRNTPHFIQRHHHARRRRRSCAAIALICFGKDPLQPAGLQRRRRLRSVRRDPADAKPLGLGRDRLALLLATFWFLKCTDLGRAVRACSINLQAARLMGVDAERLTLIVFAVAGATGALAGIVVTPIVLGQLGCRNRIRVSRGSSARYSADCARPTMAVLGGLGIGVVEVARPPATFRPA